MSYGVCYTTNGQTDRLKRHEGTGATPKLPAIKFAPLGFVSGPKRISSHLSGLLGGSEAPQRGLVGL